MSYRVTVKDVRAALERLKSIASDCGMDTGGWVLDIGSSTYGRAYRLFGQDRYTLDFTGWNGYLGWTAREATDALHNIANGMSAAHKAVLSERNAHTLAELKSGNWPDRARFVYQGGL